MLNKFLYAILKLLSRIPFWLVYPISDFVSWVLCYVVRYRRRVVLENLTRCFPEKSHAWRHNVAREFYRGFTDTLLESVKGMTISEDEALRRFKFKNYDQVKKDFDSQGCNHILMFGHCANWEWMMFTKVVFGQMDMVALYQKIENPLVNEKTREARQRFGMTTVEGKDSFRHLAKLPNDGNTIIAFVADQTPTTNNIRHWVDFFGVPTPAHIGANQVAKKLRYSVFFLENKRVKRGHYEVTATPIYHPDEEVTEYEIIDRFFALLEQQIRNSPQCWLWSHKRWKYAQNPPAKKD